MLNKKVQTSIIIVNYKVERELLDCISSIIKSKPKTTYEIIVVDNDEENKIEKELKSRFPKVKYIRSSKNIGFGAGNNLGTKYAQGEYLFFLNPDTKILDRALDNLHNFIVKNDNVGIISPIFLDDNLTPFKSQGSRELTPKTVLFSQSLLWKIFPDKNIYNDNVSDDWNMKAPISVDTIPGAAMMINSSFFKKIGGFDEKFFLYFEENDISKRVSNLGYKLFIVPSAKIIHLVGRSTRNIKNMEDIYSKSRYLYLRKHYGLSKAIPTQALLSIDKTYIFIFLILAVAFFLRVANLESNMPFIGDQGWFYLSARDMLINGQIPLVGIASSHPWLHQGPLWTYMLAGVFWAFGFNPLNGAYLTIALGTFSVLLVYIVGSEMFSKRIGIISAILYATSPLVIIHSRTPYHTSPIPLFTLLFILSLFKWIKGNYNFFPLTIFFLAILYNLELATAMLWFVLFIVLGYGLWKKKEWVKKTFNKKNLIYSFLAFLIPMTPILIYDFSNNFPQTLKFIIWIGYRILKFFGFPSIHGEVDSINFNSMIVFSFHFYQYLIFAASSIIAFAILILSFGALLVDIYLQFKEKIYESGFILLFLWILISILGYFMNSTSSEAYLPILFPALIYSVAFLFNKIMKTKTLHILAMFIVIILAFINSYFIISKEYFTSNKLNFTSRLSVAKEIVKKSNGREYNIVGIGKGSQFESFTMNYEYLTWWLGHSPSVFSQKLKFIIQEDEKGVSLKENE